MIEADDFTRRFTMRAANLMWLLGAGCSASAGIPTAGDMVWEFKQKLYVSQRRVSLKSINDLSNPAIREQLQSYIDASGRFPARGAPSEYSALFEATWPNEADRRAYLDGKLTGAKPSYGHYALATLMSAGMAKLVWTTNFDTLTADACAKVYDSTGPLTIVALDAPDMANETINAQRWPIEIKLHGDFRSRRLKNTGDELRQQDARLRQVLVDSCGPCRCRLQRARRVCHGCFNGGAGPAQSFSGRTFLVASRGRSAASSRRDIVAACRPARRGWRPRSH
jgi:NAD-dependent SIR2 family protein deacetylase